MNASDFPTDYTQVSLPYPGPRIISSAVLIDENLDPIRLSFRGNRFGLHPDGPFQKPDFATAYMSPLLAYGALASPPMLIQRFGELASRILILPCSLVDGCETGWAKGGRFTLISADHRSAETAWLVMFPNDPELAVLLDLVEGRPRFYNLARLNRGSVMIAGQQLENPLTYIGSFPNRAPLDGEVCPHTVIPVDTLLCDIAPTPQEQQVIDWALTGAPRRESL